MYVRMNLTDENQINPQIHDVVNRHTLRCVFEDLPRFYSQRPLAGMGATNDKNTDNAAMIGIVGYFKYLEQNFSGYETTAASRLKL